MSALFYLPFVAAALSFLLAGASLFRLRRSPAAWCVSAGMTALALESIFTGLAVGSIPMADVVFWLALAYIAKCLGTGAWLGFSLVYSRGDHRQTLARWGLPLALALLAVAGAALGLGRDLFEIRVDDLNADAWRLRFTPVARVLNVALLTMLVLTLTNLELTFRAALGTMRWRIKYVVLGVALILGARLYVRAQAILFSAPDIALWSVESGATAIGSLFLMLGYARSRIGETEVYPSSAVARSSVTVLIVGAYLFVVGVLAQFVKNFGGAEIFRFQAIIVLLGLTGLALLLLSERLRRYLHVLVVRHFSKAQHDSVRIWTAVSRRLAQVPDTRALGQSAAALMSETFGALSVTLWVLEDDGSRLVVAASTSQHNPDDASVANSGELLAGLERQTKPFDLEEPTDAWAAEFRRLNAGTFTTGGHRLCLPLHTADGTLGVIVLGDRVNGSPYSLEELELLECIGAQITSVIQNLRQAHQLAQAKELEALRTMSAFFVHDLKNAAASLNLMLKNAPVHFEDPEFRADALRGIGNTAKRIDDMIARLSAIRDRPAAMRESTDLNQLVDEALDGVPGVPDVGITRDLQPVPRISADREQIRSVVTNLVLNAREAVEAGGVVCVGTETREGRVVLSISDNGCGMSEGFVRESLFRPFQSTKKKGLGIGLFQCRAIVQAHGGGIQVTSKVGAGTTFVVSFPSGSDR